VNGLFGDQVRYKDVYQIIIASGF